MVNLSDKIKKTKFEVVEIEYKRDDIPETWITVWKNKENNEVYMEIPSMIITAEEEIEDLINILNKAKYYLKKN